MSFNLKEATIIVLKKKNFFKIPFRHCEGRKQTRKKAGKGRTAHVNPLNKILIIRALVYHSRISGSNIYSIEGLIRN